MSLDQSSLSPFPTALETHARWISWSSYYCRGVLFLLSISRVHAQALRSVNRKDLDMVQHCFPLSSSTSCLAILTKCHRSPPARDFHWRTATQRLRNVIATSHCTSSCASPLKTLTISRQTTLLHRPNNTIWRAMYAPMAVTTIAFRSARALPHPYHLGIWSGVYEAREQSSRFLQVSWTWMMNPYGLMLHWTVPS